MSAFAQPAVAQIRAWSLKTELVVLLPDLRAFSLFLCRDRGASDDLTQDTVVLALAKQHDFEPGTNLKAWLFTIMRSHFYSGLRSTRRRAMWMGVSDVEGEPGIDIADRSSGLIDLSKVLWRLSAAYREALSLRFRIADAKQAWALFERAIGTKSFTS